MTTHDRPQTNPKRGFLSFCDPDPKMEEISLEQTLNTKKPGRNAIPEGVATDSKCALCG